MSSSKEQGYSNSSENWSLSEEVNEIITSVPSWIIRWGITILLLVLLSIILLSALIRYPDVVKTTLKVKSLNSPKGIFSRQSGKLVKLLVKENERVRAKQPLAYMESLASHDDIILFAAKLKDISRQFDTSQKLSNIITFRKSLNLGEIQESFEQFYQEYLSFINTQPGGFYHTQRTYLEKDLEYIKRLQEQIKQQQEVQEIEYSNSEERYQAYLRLKSKNVVSNSEFKEQENRYLASKYPLQQSITALLNNNNAYFAKQREIATLNNTISEQRAKFRQALNSMISDTDAWLVQYVLLSPLEGKVSFAGVLQENQNIGINQEIFIINPGNTNFFGEVLIPQYKMGKVRVGQHTLVKLRSYPFEEYGLINGRVSYIAEVPLRDSVFIAKIDFGKFEHKAPKYPIALKPGMLAEAEIITQENSLLQRFLNNITKMLNSN